MLPMTRTCPSCQKLIAVPPEAIGKKVRCSGCQAVFRIEDDGMSPASLSIEASVAWEAPTPAAEAAPTDAKSFDFGDDSPGPGRNRERPQHVTERSLKFVPDTAMRASSLHAAMWMGGLCMSIVLLIVLRFLVLWRMSAINQTGENAWMVASVASAMLLFCVLGIVVGVVSLHLRLTPILSYLASGLCILVAILSFCGTFASIANIEAAQDSIVRQRLGQSVFLSLVMLVLSVKCAVVGFSASNLLVRHRGALAKLAGTNDGSERN